MSRSTLKGGRYIGGRYKASNGINDTWSVLDQQVQKPVEMGVRQAVGMNYRDAKELSDLLNSLEDRRQAC
ncbi:hypothetical protein FHW03_001439 [Ochrobactrum sp. RH2CCR150]|nr:hypothetical protein [Ochrobactrum sp. RH2CCR150]